MSGREEGSEKGCDLVKEVGVQGREWGLRGEARGSVTRRGGSESGTFRSNLIKYL